MFPRVGKHWETLVRNIGKHQMFLKLVGNILLPGKQILFPQQQLFPIEQNFDLDKSGQKSYHSLKEHHKISNIPKFGCEML